MSRLHRFLAASALVLATLGTGAAAPSTEEPRTIVIEARRFEFEPKEIHLKKDETARLRVVSADVTHGFFQRALRIDLDVVPGQPSEVTVTPRAAGTYTLICDHFCGAQHGNMKMTIVVE